MPRLLIIWVYLNANAECIWQYYNKMTFTNDLTLLWFRIPSNNFFWLLEKYLHIYCFRIFLAKLQYMFPIQKCILSINIKFCVFSIILDIFDVRYMKHKIISYQMKYRRTLNFNRYNLLQLNAVSQCHFHFLSATYVYI